jgi:hypothetical protein
MTDEQPFPPITINKDGSIVLETKYADSGERCQIIFKPKGRGLGWTFHICNPYVEDFYITSTQVKGLIYGLQGGME